MCQRCQKSMTFNALYGELKFIGKRIENIRAKPMAISE